MSDQLCEVTWDGKTFWVPTVWSRGAQWYQCPFCPDNKNNRDKLGKHIVLEHLKTTYLEDICVEYAEVYRGGRKRFRCLHCEFEGDAARDIITHDIELHRSPPSLSDAASPDAQKTSRRRKTFDLAAKVAQWRLESPSGLTPEQERHRAEIKQEAVAQLHSEAEAFWKLGSAENLEQRLEARAAAILTEMYRDIEESENRTVVETEQEMGSDMVWELDESGQRRIPRRETLAVFAPRDEWQRRAGPVWPNQQIALREELRQALEQAVIFWRRKHSKWSGSSPHESLSSRATSPARMSTERSGRREMEDDPTQTIEVGSIPSGESWGELPTESGRLEPGSIPSSEEWGHPILVQQVDFKPQNYVVKYDSTYPQAGEALERDLFRLARRIQLLHHPVAPPESPDRWIQMVRFGQSPNQPLELLDLIESSAVWCDGRALAYLDGGKAHDAERYDEFAHQFRAMARAAINQGTRVPQPTILKANDEIPTPPTPPSAPVNKRKGGRPADAHANWKIAKILISFQDWRKDLLRVCARLEKAKIKIPDSKKWKQEGCFDWSDILQADEAGLIRALQHRLDWVARNPPPA